MVTLEVVYGRQRGSLKAPLLVFGLAVMGIGTVILLEAQYALAGLTMGIGFGIVLTSFAIPRPELRQPCPNCATRIHGSARICPQCRLETGWKHEEPAPRPVQALRVRVREER